MKLISRPCAACAVGAVLMLAAGCTSTSADGPSSESLATPTASASVVDPSTASPTSSDPSIPTPSVIDPPSPTSVSLDPAAQEAADRAAVEATWAEFWRVSDSLTQVPEADRLATASSVAVEPTLSQLLEQTRSLEAKGREIYGESQFHPYWEEPIDGKGIAVMGDCTDTSKSGARDKASGTVRTVGVPDNNTRATFLLGSDDQWRVEKIFFLVDTPCP